MESTELRSAAGSWRSSMEALLDVAQRVGPVDALVADLGVGDEDELDAVVDRQTDAVIADSERILGLLEREAGPDEHEQMLAALVGDVTLADALAAAGDSAADFFGDFGLGADPSEVLRSTRAELDTFQAIVAGLRPVAGGQVAPPPELAARFEVLEEAAGTELVELATSDVMWALAAGAITGLGDVAQGVAAFDRLREVVTGWAKALKKAALKLVKWVVEQVARLLPAALRQRVDDAWERLREQLAANIPSWVGNVVGGLFGRPEAEAAWATAAADPARDLSAAIAALGTSIDGEVRRIGWITSGRKKIDGVGSKVIGVANAAAPVARIAFGAAALLVFGFVVWQVFDGCNDIEALVAAPADAG